MACSIFFSHSTGDRRWCEWLAADAERFEIEAYLAEHDHKAGGSLAEKVKRNIERSSAMVVLLTADSASSTYVQQEIGYALAKRKLVIPLVAPGFSRERLGMLQGVEYIEFDLANPYVGKESFAAELRRVAERQRKLDDLETLIALGICVGLLALMLRDAGSVPVPA